MAEIKKTVEVPVSTRVETVGLECDVCSKKSAQRDGWATNGCYGVEKTTLKFEEGNNFPDCTNIDVEEFDLCPDCWRKHVRDHLISLGATPRTREISY